MSISPCCNSENDCRVVCHDFRFLSPKINFINQIVSQLFQKVRPFSKKTLIKTIKLFGAVILKFDWFKRPVHFLVHSHDLLHALLTAGGEDVHVARRVHHQLNNFVRTLSNKLGTGF